MSGGETDEKKEEQPDGIKYTINETLEILSKVNYRFDNCGDIRYLSAIIPTKPFMKTLLDIKNKGIKIRVITEMTKDNLSYCKELMQVVSEVRHLDRVRGNFTVTDTEYLSYAISSEAARPSLTKAVITTSKELVRQQQHSFDMIWNKAIPAEHKITEMELGIMLPERTEIINGADNILRLTLESVPHIRERLDNCIDSNSPASFVLFEPMWNHLKELASTKNGVKFRFITEITKDNLLYCKEVAKIFELRHLDGIKGNLGIIDGREYRASPSIKPGVPPDVLIRSTAKVFVEQQQFFFETLWNKAIPAKHRIKEIEEGRAPEKLEIMEDTQKSIGRAFDIMNKTQKELLVLFATPRTFSFALQGEAADIYKKISKNGVNIKLLVPRGGTDEVEEENEQMEKVQEISPSINLRFSELDLNTRITIMISDRNEFMSWELRDDTLDDPYLAGGIATYSNIKSVASSYAIIFDNLWKITELAENLRIANVKLESNEKAMKEFINIAAHELRTPIQPILGLSEMLADARNDPQKHRKFVEVIVRNAHKLENLAEDILDVTQIESGHLQLSMEKIDLHELVESAVLDFEEVIKNEFNKNGKASKAIISIKDEYSRDKAADQNLERPVVLADPNRIVQVITNLLSNAVKFSTQGDRATITVTRGIRVIHDKSMAFVSISDQGQGIKPEIMPKLFQKFISGGEKGTGLGLYISKNIVKAHGGEIWAENNRDGIGANFAFTLPILKS